MRGFQNMQLLNLALTLEWNLLFRQLNMFRLVWYPLLVGYFVHILCSWGPRQCLE